MNERLTREEVERCRTLLYDAAPRYKELQALCDLALSALDREEPPMTNDELAKEIKQRRGGTDMLNSVLMPHQWEQIIAALRRVPDPKDTVQMEWFRKGRESVLRKNQSGCCCLFNEEDEIVSVCMAHKEWAERPPSGEMVDGTIIRMRSCPNCKEGWIAAEMMKP